MTQKIKFCFLPVAPRFVHPFFLQFMIMHKVILCFLMINESHENTVHSCLKDSTLSNHESSLLITKTTGETHSFHEQQHPLVLGLLYPSRPPVSVGQSSNRAETIRIGEVNKNSSHILKAGEPTVFHEYEFGIRNN